MKVVRKQTVSQQPHIKTRNGLGEDSLKGRVILVGLEDSQPGIGPVKSVIEEAALRRSSSVWARTTLKRQEQGVTKGS
jgi:hypothetical protein